MKRKFPLQHKILRQLREERGLTLQQIADDVGISVTRVFRIENGLSELRVSDAIKLEEIFNISLIKELRDEYRNLPRDHVSAIRA